MESKVPHIETDQKPTRKSEARTILEGFGFFLLGYVGFFASFWYTGKVKAIVGIATLFGGGLIGQGVFRLIFGNRMPKVELCVAILSAVFGLVVTLASLFLLIGDDFM